MREDRDLLAEVRDALERVAPPEPDLEPVIRRARSLRARRTVAGAAALTVIAAGVLVPLGALGRLGSRPEVQRSPNTQPTLGPEPGPVLDFQPAPGWNVVRTDPSLAALPGAPQAWAANVPFAPSDLPPGVAQVFPGGDPADTIEGLPADGIVVLSALPVETRNPLPPNRSFPARNLPLQLKHPPFSGWEGQRRPDLSMAGVSATVNGWWVSVTVIFGTDDPSDALFREAQEQVARLIVPPPPPVTNAFDQFGIRMQRPDGWYGSLTAWAASTPVLQASTVPITDLYDASSARKALGPNDLFILLVENDAMAADYEPVTLPIAVRPEDACPTCEVNDNGTFPPPDHLLFYRSFATSEGRQFDLWAEFGMTAVSSDQLARLNEVLSTLQVDPPTSPRFSPPQAGPAPDGSVSADLPAGWTEQRDPVPAAVDPRVVAAYGTWDFPTGGECGPERALEALPADGAFVWVEEHADPPNRGDFEIPAPPRSIDLQTPPARWRCAAAAPSRMYLFRQAGRYFEMHVAFGPSASAGTIAAAEDLMAGFSAGPAG